ncbi:MAG: DUF3179 domain-containing protein [Haloarculaceae archaeon]
MSRLTRRHFLATTGAATLAGCTGLVTGPGNDTRGDDTGGGDASGGDASGGGARSTPTCESAIEDGSPTPLPTDVDESGPVPTTETQLPLPMSPSALQGESRSGGPPKDGIPSIDEPQFVGADEAAFLSDRDVVFGVVHDGVVRAYPQRILAQHEIVNDTLAGDAVAVTYCPLTGTAMGFFRGSTTLGVSGRLINNNLVMYDRETEAWWPQILATSIPGTWNEDPEIRSLQEFRVVWARWADWRDHHPDTRVLSTETGYARNYSDDPYGSYTPLSGYYEGGRPMFPSLSDDDRFDPKAVVMGARTSDGAAAFLKRGLRENGLVAGELGGTPVLAVHDPRYDTGYVYENPDGRSFSFDADCGYVVGDGEQYAPDSLPLARVYTFDAMWFAWSGYYPDSNVYA